MSIIDSLKERLAAYPDLQWTASSQSIEVPARDPSGFPVCLRSSDEGWSVSFDAWHEEFTSESEAIACFLTGLGPRVRIAVTYRGATPTKWTLEGKRGERWVADTTTALLFTPFWRRARVEYFQNHLTIPEASTQPSDTPHSEARSRSR